MGCHSSDGPVESGQLLSQLMEILDLKHNTTHEGGTFTSKDHKVKSNKSRSLGYIQQRSKDPYLFIFIYLLDI